MDYSIEHSLKQAGLEVMPQAISKKDLMSILREYFMIAALGSRS
jgi:hypothetical protein